MLSFYKYTGFKKPKYQKLPIKLMLESVRVSVRADTTDKIRLDPKPAKSGASAVWSVQRGRI